MIAETAIATVGMLEIDLLLRGHVSQLAQQSAGYHAPRPIEAGAVEGKAVTLITVEDHELSAATFQGYDLIRADIGQLSIGQKVQHRRLSRGCKTCRRSKLLTIGRDAIDQNG